MRKVLLYSVLLLLTLDLLANVLPDCHGVGKRQKDECDKHLTHFKLLGGAEIAVGSGMVIGAVGFPLMKMLFPGFCCSVFPDENRCLTCLCYFSGGGVFGTMLGGLVAFFIVAPYLNAEPELPPEGVNPYQ